MVISRYKLLRYSPLFFAAYFTRIGELSLYIFDIYIVVLILFFIPVIPRKIFYTSVIVSTALVLGASLGFVNGALQGTEGDSIQLIVVCIRYIQFFLFTIIVIVAARGPRAGEVFGSSGILYVALMMPLFYGLIFLYLNPEKVLFARRLASYLGNPNGLGMYICISVVPMIVTIKLLHKKPAIKMLLGSLYIAAVLASLYYAGSNTGWILTGIITIAAGIISIVLNNKFNKLYLLFFGLVIIVVPIFLLTILPAEELKQRGVNNTIDFAEALIYGDDILELGSGQLRQNLMIDSIQLTFKSPLNFIVGIGLGQSPSLIGRSYFATITAHNTYIVLLMEGGLVVLFILAYMFFIMVKLSHSIPTIIIIFAGYFLAMLGSPHVYLPFFWGPVVFGSGLALANFKFSDNRSNSFSFSSTINTLAR